MFLKEENVFGIYTLECGFDSIKTRGSLAKSPSKGYPSIWTVGSDPNGPDLKKRGRWWLSAGEEGHVAARHYQRRPSSPAQAKMALEATI
jgi:hypothetical protein